MRNMVHAFGPVAGVQPGILLGIPWSSFFFVSPSIKPDQPEFLRLPLETEVMASFEVALPHSEVSPQTLSPRLQHSP